jgi:predicted metalloprotease with PDZ domain
VVHEDPSQLAQRLGLRVAESGGVVVKTVLRGGAAEKAGFAAGDEWLGVAPPKSAGPGWRITRLEDLTEVAGSAKKVTALVSRDKRLMQLSLTLPTASTTWRLALKDASRVDSWLNG